MKMNQKVLFTHLMRPSKKQVSKLFKANFRKSLKKIDFLLKEIGKCQTILIILTGLSVMGAVVENISVGIIIPYAKCELNLSTTEKAILNSISFVGIVSSSHILGCLADTWGRQKVIRIAAIGGFICSACSGFAVDTVSLIVLRFIAGAL